MGSDHEHRVCTYQEAEDAIMAHEKFYVNDCFCRGPARDGKAAWDYCGHTVETCLGFDPPEADDDFTAREIDREEALDLFEDWKRQGHMFRFMIDESWLCFCCACGCGFFRDKEGNRVEDPCDTSSFIERTNADRCEVCGKCISVCAHEARWREDGVIRVDEHRCYGCGACEYVCPDRAITMVPRIH